MIMRSSPKGQFYSNLFLNLKKKLHSEKRFIMSSLKIGLTLHLCNKVSNNLTHSNKEILVNKLITSKLSRVHDS